MQRDTGRWGCRKAIKKNKIRTRGKVENGVRTAIMEKKRGSSGVRRVIGNSSMTKKI